MDSKNATKDIRLVLRSISNLHHFAPLVAVRNFFRSIGSAATAGSLELLGRRRGRRWRRHFGWACWPPLVQFIRKARFIGLDRTCGGRRSKKQGKPYEFSISHISSVECAKDAVFRHEKYRHYDKCCIVRINEAPDGSAESHKKSVLVLRNVYAWTLFCLPAPQAHARQHAMHQLRDSPPHLPSMEEARFLEARSRRHDARAGCVHRWRHQR